MQICSETFRQQSEDCIDRKGSKSIPVYLMDKEPWYKHQHFRQYCIYQTLCKPHSKFFFWHDKGKYKLHWIRTILINIYSQMKWVRVSRTFTVKDTSSTAVSIFFLFQDSARLSMAPSVFLKSTYLSSIHLPHCKSYYNINGGFRRERIKKVIVKVFFFYCFMYRHYPRTSTLHHPFRPS